MTSDFHQILAYMSHLARIELTAEEEHLLAPQFEKIIGHINTLNTVDTKSVEPMFNVISLKNVLRDDVAEKKDVAVKIIANFPQREGNFCKVPKVIE